MRIANPRLDSLHAQLNLLPGSLIPSVSHSGYAKRLACVGQLGSGSVQGHDVPGVLVPADSRPS